MVTFNVAIRALGGLTLLMAPIAIAIWIVLRLKIRGIWLHVDGATAAARQLFNYRMGSYLVFVLILVSLLFWVGLFLAVRFDWSPSDVSEIEISVFQSPDPAARPERNISIKEADALSRLFKGLKSLQSYESMGHEHAVGRSYVLRLRRRSDGRWSNYLVRINPDKEPAGGGVRMKGVYQVSLEVVWGKFNLGHYQSPELGRRVEELANRPLPDYRARE